ncbi:LlaI.2 [Bifidobacterium animalis subsp. animalis IM386]|uniref:LlaI.2 n=1 Tax=Bifidobacterium animalis subsp. animalis IM386 TaxID=1402194 RepID=A0AAV2W0P7_9BIFI|nr:AAA family ATPase [Bifidobacterium animalis]AFI62268.1 LlaI.2 [Bifidobacterium animalis subsp. animalis ATCC 25527]AYN22910.1 LlaI.2 [Bifidobacterium animalis subsp. animalis]KFI39596.1 type II restriction-modification system restriction subunit [Bifidobacterium animalis subsp. animalis]CDI67089.1 LlaI.2 [Bifidobacterium animalis subsp. animalis IM386]
MPSANDVVLSSCGCFKELLKYFYAQSSFDYAAGGMGSINTLPAPGIPVTGDEARRLSLFHLEKLLRQPLHIFGMEFTINFGRLSMGLPGGMRKISSTNAFLNTKPSIVADCCTYIAIKTPYLKPTERLAIFADLTCRKVGKRMIGKQFTSYFTWAKEDAALKSLRLGIIREGGIQFMPEARYRFVDLGLSSDENTPSFLKLLDDLKTYGARLPKPSKTASAGPAQQLVAPEATSVPEPSQLPTRKEPPRIEIRQPRNWIIFGAPGTGKSHTIDRIINALPSDVGSRRITFYPDYTYSQFVGTYKPIPVRRAIPAGAGDAKEVAGEDITYRFVAGPFVKTLVDALLHPRQPQILIIEEINRAEPASVFGNVFQLLDRKASGVSEYPVDVSDDLQDYLQATLENNPEATRLLARLVGSRRVDSFECDRIAIPSNMYIWATMNSADQGVFAMDTAFKRRWTFKYLPLDGLDPGPAEESSPLQREWETIREGINGMLKKNGRDIPEDKLLGRYFLNKTDLKDRRAFTEAFGSKVVMYLFEDAARYCRDAIFKDTSGSGQLYLGDLLANLDLAPNSSDLGIFKENVHTPEA